MPTDHDRDLADKLRVDSAPATALAARATAPAAYGETAGPAVLLRSGRTVDPFAVRAEDIDIRDIAHGLAHTCRWGGQTAFFYSVASHSLAVAHRATNIVRFDADILVAMDMETEAEALTLTAAYGLLHDAAEYLIGDVRQPIKRRPELAAVREAEEKILVEIYSAFCLPLITPTFIARAVREADAIETRREARWLMPPSRAFGSFDDVEDLTPIMPGLLGRLWPEQAEYDFIVEAQRLLGGEVLR